MVRAIPPLRCAAICEPASRNRSLAIAANIQITYGSATDSKVTQGLEITGVSGTFSDANIGIANAPILGLLAINYATPEATNR